MVIQCSPSVVDESVLQTHMEEVSSLVGYSCEAKTPPKEEAVLWRETASHGDRQSSAFFR